MIDIHLRKIRARADISAEEEQAIRGLVSEVRDVQPDRTVVHHGEELHSSTILLDGWMARAKDLPTGQRQVAEISLPGDFTDLHGFTLKRLDHDIVSFTRCRVAVVPHERLMTLTERYPRLTRIYWFLTNIDAAIHREWTLSLGRRTAISRIAQLFCELDVRLGIVELAHDHSYDFPLTQVELGECLGLTSVHVNRTLQELRRKGLLDLQGRRVTIHNLGALKMIAEFDPAYLYLGKRPH